MLKILFYIFTSLSLFANDQIPKDQILTRLKDYIDSYNEGNFDKFKTFWTEEGTFTNPTTGEEVSGREQIASFFQERYKSLNGNKVVFNILSVQLQDPNKAIVEGTFQRNTGIQAKRARRIELVNDKGVWLIQSIREIDVDDPPNLYDHLKPLEWLLGKWNDKDEDVTIKFETKWDKYRNFILQHFTTVIYGVEELEGRQFIGWDPVQEKIRSWIFDSDGGFGSGIWSQNEKSWQVSVTYTLSDGRQAIATDIYTPIDDNSYTYQSVGRSVDGQFLPNIDPVTVYKEKS